VPLVVHQQDVIPGLANRILAPFATCLSVAFAETSFGTRHATSVVGNPVRASVLAGSAEGARDRFQLREDLPVVLITGGGTGALRLNELAAEAAVALVDECQVVHLTGAGRSVGSWSHPNYHCFEFLTEEMADVLAVADVVVTRAGLSSLAEIAALRKAAIIVPMPESHQEANAGALQRRDAAIVVDQASLTPELLAKRIRALLADPARRVALGAAAAKVLPTDAAHALARSIGELVGATPG
jgi:UDP-N-acetylglucosamine--N-acetylmuramyl-(pentapeptide) pyrophosphoryl-undecaprenol N-acetylglucosamine transferase